MLRLPIAERKAAEIAEVGRQVFRGAYTDDSQIVVKNTFLSVEGVPADGRGDSREVQTCTARFSSSAAAIFPGVSGGRSDASSEETASLQEEDFPSSITVIPEGCTAYGLRELPNLGAAPNATATVPDKTASQELAEGVRLVVKNTFIDVDCNTPGPLSDKSASCTARFNGAERPLNFTGGGSPPSVSSSAKPTSPPPAYPAPTLSRVCSGARNEPPPPPPHLPDLGRNLFLAALDKRAFEGDGDRSGADSGAGSKTSGGQQWVVKNTFLELDSDDEEDEEQRGAQTCLGRYSGPAPQLFPPTPALGQGKLLAECGAEDVQEDVPSAGSKSHGMFGEDGQPLCQPCAWFFKQSGCLNSINCRYCHLCPQGELKRRKKEKIAKLREADAAAAAAAAAAEGSAEAAASTAVPAPISPAQAPLAPAPVQLAPAPALLAPAPAWAPAHALAPQSHLTQQVTLAPFAGGHQVTLSPFAGSRSPATQGRQVQVPPPQVAPVFLAAALDVPPPRHSASRLPMMSQGP